MWWSLPAFWEVGLIPRRKGDRTEKAAGPPLLGWAALRVYLGAMITSGASCRPTAAREETGLQLGSKQPSLTATTEMQGSRLKSVHCDAQVILPSLTQAGRSPRDTMGTGKLL